MQKRNKSNKYQTSLLFPPRLLNPGRKHSARTSQSRRRRRAEQPIKASSVRAFQRHRPRPTTPIGCRRAAQAICHFYGRLWEATGASGLSSWRHWAEFLIVQPNTKNQCSKKKKIIIISYLIVCVPQNKFYIIYIILHYIIFNSDVMWYMKMHKKYFIVNKLS